MPIFNASVTGEGGGQGGGDKVTALVGSNASGVDVGDKVILNYPATYDINYTSGSPFGWPIYFDGYYLVSTGGRYSANSGVLTRLGDSEIASGWVTNATTLLKALPPNFLPDGTQFFSEKITSGILYIKDGSISGTLGYDDNYNCFLCDSRLDSSKTGFAIRSSAYSGGSAYAYLHYMSSGSSATTLYATGGIGAIFTEAGGTYYIYYQSTYGHHKVTSCTWNGSSISTSDLFTTTTLKNMGLEGSTDYSACCTSRVDDYTFWYKPNIQYYGFTKFNLLNSSLDSVSPPSALSIVQGTILGAWWDLDNKFYMRTTLGLYVFSYSNHDLSTMTLVKKFEWVSDYTGSAVCSPDFKSYSVGNSSEGLVVSEAAMPVYEFSANVYNGQNFAGTSLTGFVNEAISTDPWGQSIVEVNTVKDPADTWTNVGTPFGFDVSTTSSDVSVGWGYYNSGSAEVIIPATVTKTIAQIGTNQTLGYKNDIYVYRDTSDVCSDLMCKTGTTPVGTFKVSTALTTSVYLSPDKTAIAGTNADRGFAVSYEAEHATQTNYTVVGSPTIDSNYVASGFSNSSYLNIGRFLPGNSAWEAIFKVKTPLSITRQNLLVGATSNFAGCGFAIELSGGKTFGAGFTSSTVWDWDIGWISSSFVVQENTDYWVKVYFTGSSYHLALSTDGILYTDLGSLVSSSKILSNPQDLQLGTTSSSSNCWSGSIDLKECYMNVNGETVWKGAIPATNGSVTVGEGYSYIDETDAPFYLDSDLTQNASQMVVHSEDFVEQTVQTNIADFNVVGSPTIQNKVASGFSTSNYLKFGAFEHNNLPWEISFPFKVDSSVSTEQYIFSTGILNSSGTLRGARIAIYDSKLTAGLSFDGLSLNYSLIGSTLSTGIDYVVKLVFTGSSYELYLNDVLEDSYSSSSTICTCNDSYIGVLPLNGAISYPTYCSVDLGNMYMKVNNNIVWTPYKIETVKQGTLFLTQPTAGTTSTVVSANATPTATYVGSVVDPIDTGKTVTMDTTLTKIIDVS